MNIGKVFLPSMIVLATTFVGNSTFGHGLHSYDQENPNPPTKHKIQSSFPTEGREFLIQLPVGYAQENERYPVLFLLDADRPFVLQETVSMVNTLVDRHKMPKLIIVALPNATDAARNRDYTPSQQASQFLDFIEFELIPYLDANFRTEALRLYSGHSRSGLLGMYALLTRPHLFKAYFTLSPAFWHDDDLIIEQAKETLQAVESLPNFLYLNIGGEENENITNSFDRMKFVLNRYAPQDLNWQADYAEFESHGTTRPIGHYNALRIFFTNWDKRYDDE